MEAWHWALIDWHWTIILGIVLGILALVVIVAKCPEVIGDLLEGIIDAFT